MKILIDTCVALDFILQREPFNKDAKMVFIRALNENADAYITVKALTDIYYVVRKVSCSEKTAKEKIDDLLMITDLLDSAAFDARMALNSSFNDYEDAVMMKTALNNGIDYIVTRNLKDYMNSEVPALSPTEFLNLNLWTPR